LYPTAGFDVKIGIRYNGSGREFTGAIDDLRIYNRVLSHAEVAWLAGPVLIGLTLFAGTVVVILVFLVVVLLALSVIPSFKPDQISGSRRYGKIRPIMLRGYVSSYGAQHFAILIAADNKLPQ
jgi:hypothetical protein